MLSLPRWILLLGACALLVPFDASGQSLAAPGLDEPPYQALFDLELIAQSVHAPGSVYRPEVVVHGSYDDAPRAGRTLAGTLKLEGKGPVTTLATTDALGRATFAFPLPDIDTEGTFEVVLEEQGWRRTVRADVRLIHDVRCELTTAKRIYQPGQTVQGRMHCLRDGRAWGALPIELTINGQRGRQVARHTLTTSAFGIAGFEWVVPEQAPEGTYDLEAETGSRWLGGGVIVVARYERASILVGAEVAGPVLPGQVGRVTVTVRTPDGRPAPDAALRVFSSDGEHEISEVHGVTNAEGRAELMLDLSVPLAELTEDEDLDWWSQTEDIPLTVEAIDPLSDRVESLAIHVRIARSPILIFLDTDDTTSPEGVGLLVRTQYADGRPASCRVMVRDDVTPIVSTRTDAWGLARAWVSADHLPRLGDGETLTVRAVDDLDRRGEIHAPMWLQPASLALGAEQVLLETGQDLPIVIDSDAPRTVHLEVFRQVRRIAARTVDVAAGRTRVPVSVEPGTRGVVGVVAWVLEDEALETDRIFLAYPDDRGLRLAVERSEATHRPGETANLHFAVTDTEGRPVPAALGVGVVDQTIEQRQRQRTGLGPPLAEDRRADVAGWDLDRLLDPRRTPDERRALDALARLMLWEHHGYLGLSASRPIGQERRDYDDFFDAQQEGWRQAVRDGLRSMPYRDRLDAAWATGVLRAQGIDVGSLRDPWDRPYRVDTEIRGATVRVMLRSAGRDGRWDSRDDFVAWSYDWRYFAPLAGALMDRLASRFEAQLRLVGGDLSAFDDALASVQGGTEPRDPWGGRYRLALRPSWGGTVRVDVWSDGPDGVPRPIDGRPNEHDDRSVWQLYLPIGDRYALRAQSCLRTQVVVDGDDVAARLRDCGEEPERWRDGYGTPVRFDVETRSRFATRHRTEPDTGVQLEEQVTEHLRVFEVVSAGQDREMGTEDDHVIGRIFEPRLWQTESGRIERPPPGVRLTGDLGAIQTTIRDPDGGALPGATVNIVGIDDVRVAISDVRGQTSMILPKGSYHLTVILDGFSTVEYPVVDVERGRVTILDIELAPAVEETITVSSQSPLLDERRISTGSTLSKRSDEERTPEGATAPEAGSPIFPRPVPRIRRVFPETALWAPEIVTGADGTAGVPVPLPDSITTWHVVARASTIDGRWAVIDQDLQVRLPLFIEPDLPPFVTVGDSVSIPTFVHNLLPASSSVELEARLDGRRIGRDRQQLESGAVGTWSAPVTFPRPGSATLAVEAWTVDVADAVERTTEVRFDGRRRQTTTVALGRDAGRLGVTVPKAAIDGSARLRVRVYQDPASHLVDALVAMARQPTGCAEQVVSAAYPALFVLDRGMAVSPPARARLQGYVHDAVEVLRRRSTDDGGFGFWRRGQADVAVTAHALAFLAEARRHAEIDPRLVDRALGWLLAAQTDDGAWRARGEDGAVTVRTLGTTAHVASALVPLAAAEHPRGAEVRAALARASDFLAPRLERVDVPDALAGWILVAEALGEADRVRLAVERLHAVVQRDADGLAYWTSKGSPFFGWGRTGAIETTGRVLRGLRAAGIEPGGDAEGRLVRDALAFLLMAKDADGWWGSTQATIQALAALQTSLDSASMSTQPGPPDRDGLNVTLQGEGELAATEESLDGTPLASAHGLVGTLGPETFALERPLKTGKHVLRIDGPSRDGTAVVATLEYYTKWSRTLRPPSSASNLRFAVDCPAPTGLRVGDDVTCAVEAERHGRGGMLIAEVGLPPGVEVDRAALGQAVAAGNAGFSSYEVTPERIRFYLWARPGGNRFSFTWRPRLPMRAQSTPSVLYDYYNPASRLEELPMPFVVAE